MSGSSANALDALNELKGIRDYVIEAQQMLKSGKMPDMTLLEQRTADLCRIIHQATSDVQKKCAPELQDLAARLDDCEQDLRSFYDNLMIPPGRNS